MTIREIRERIAKEFAAAAAAERAGNAGMVRVCARRAASASVDWWLHRHPRPHWPADGLGRLRQLAMDPLVDRSIAEAAGRLSARVTPDFAYAASTDPITDSRVVVDGLLAGEE